MEGRYVGLRARQFIAGAAALIAAGNVLSLAESVEPASAAAAVTTFAGVEVTGINCSSSPRTLSVLETGTGFRHIVGYNPATGADLRGSGVNLGGTGDTGTVVVPDVIGEDQSLGLRAEDQQGNVLGSTSVVIDCQKDQPPTSSTTSSSTTSSTTTSTSTPPASVPGGEQGRPAVGGTPPASVPGGEQGQPAVGGTTTTAVVGHEGGNAPAANVDESTTSSTTANGDQAPANSATSGDSKLARSGADTDTPVRGALAMVVVGGVTVFALRRRRNSSRTTA